MAINCERNQNQLNVGVLIVLTTKYTPFQFTLNFDFQLKHTSQFMNSLFNIVRKLLDEHFNRALELQCFELPCQKEQ